jgi:glucose-6-phosphate isomerase
MTPIGALGPVDQHSQLQLYMDGPKDKLITILSTSIKGSGPVVDVDLAKACGIDYMAGRTVGDLVDAQAHATIEALRGSGQPVRALHLGSVDEFTLGQLLMSFMLETILSAGLLGVDAFDQPAVEIGKKFARDYLSK